MMNIFAKEEQVVAQAEKLLESVPFINSQCAKEYGSLLNEYKSLLKQMTSVVRLADMTQLELRNMSQRLEIASQTDSLTGLHNRRSFNVAFHREWNSAMRMSTTLSILMIDIDHFKRFNDTYGHLQGDECLVTVAKEISQSVKRPRDFAARFGGDEFVLLLPETDATGAGRVAQTLLEGIRQRSVTHSNSPTHETVTLSIGIATVVPHKGLEKDDFLNMADKALYSAKDGRDCYRVYIE